jgi:hypothetical protein
MMKKASTPYSRSRRATSRAILISLCAILSSCDIDGFKDDLKKKVADPGNSADRVVTPGFNISAGSYSSAQAVSISTTTEGADIRYTLDGTNPTGTAGTWYAATIYVSKDTTIRAIAYKSGKKDSSIASATMHIAIPSDKVAPPWFYPGAGTYADAQSVTLSTTTSGASIYYTTDGTTPSSATSARYTGAIAVSADSMIKAIACKAGLSDSTIADASYFFSLGRVAAPSFLPAGGTYSSAQSVAISSAASGANIRYTTDGTGPTRTSGTLYSSPVAVSSSATLKAIAYQSGWTDSYISSATYTINISRVAAPTFLPPGGTYTSMQSVAISSTTSGASIRYTTDGTDPTSTTGTLYSSAVTISSSKTIKAIAYKPGMTASSVSSATYTINLGQVAAPTFLPAGGSYSSSQSVAISSTTSGASIRYTTDGTDPTSTAGTLYSSAISVSSSRTIKAIAYKLGMSDSSVVQQDYVISGSKRVATASFSPAGGSFSGDLSVSISCTTEGAAVFYSIDNSTPTINSIPYAGPVFISGNGTSVTIKAICTASGCLDSIVASATYKINYPAAAAPSFSPEGGNYQDDQYVTISCLTPDSTIFYTTDGSDPATSSIRSVGQSPVGPIAIPVYPGTTIKAISYAEGYLVSAQSSAHYERIYTLGSTGPAGGIVFYDKGSHSGSPSWRYLEVSPYDNSSGICWCNTISGHVDCESNEIGSGKKNTENIVNAFGAGDYAASLCKAFILNGYTDWFLPSIYELDALFGYFSSAGLSESLQGTYWSSSVLLQYLDYPRYYYYVWCRSNAAKSDETGIYSHSVRAIRWF